MLKKKLLCIIVIFSLLSLNLIRVVFAQSITPSQSVSETPTPGTDTAQQESDLQQQIDDLKSKISDTQSQEKTLSSQITIMDNQITVTQNRVDQTKDQIAQTQDDIQKATKRISMLEGSLDQLTKVLLTRIVENYEVGQTQPLQVLLTAQDATDFMRKENYLRIIQEHDQRIAYDTVQAKNDYASQKDIFETQKKKMLALQSQLEGYSKDLDQEKTGKQTLLTQTQGSEANYQRLLAKAQAQLSSFSRFVTSQGGASLLSGQTSCDSWGCYYSQRDSQWGGILINGQSGYSIAGYGCLLTSIAMVLSHMGHTDILPSDIAMSGGDNFAVDTAMLQYSITVKGVSLSRVGVSLDDALQSGPVIVGIYAYGGTHFVVIKSGSNGSYIMNDPYIANGHDISFTDHYSVGSIFERDKVVIH